MAQGGDQVLYDGEPGSVPLAAPTCQEFSGGDSIEAAHTGSYSFKNTPDPWHRPTIFLYCGGKGRPNLSGFDVIEFYMRAADPANPPTDPRFRIVTWYASSNEVPILNYIEGGMVDTAWRRVQIPTVDLKTPDYDLSVVDFLQWGTDINSAVTYVDDIVARDVTPPAISEVIVESNRYLRLRVSERFDPDSARILSFYTVTGAADPAYATAQSPTAVGLEWRVVDFAGGGVRGLSDAPVLRFDITLRLPAPLQPNVPYTLTVQGLTDVSANPVPATSVPVVFDPDALNPNVKVNQVGYLTDGPKWGYLGGYLGDMGGGIWAVGDSGAILRWQPSTGWTVEQVTTSTLRAVQPLTESDVWAVGDMGTVLHWDGAGWQPVPVPTTADLFDISFTPELEGWIVGSGGTILHRLPGSIDWELMSSPTAATLRGVFANNANVALAAGDAGTLLNWDGVSWTSTSGVTTATLHDVGGFPNSAMWAVGEQGTIIQRQYGTWYVRSSPTTAVLREVAGDPQGGFVIAGDGGVIVRRSDYGDDTFELDVTPGVTDLNAVAFLDYRQGFALGSAGGAYWYNWSTGSWDTTSLPPIPGAVHGAAALPYGALRITDTSVEIIDATTGAVGLTVPLVFRAANWHLSGEDVFAFDFSALTTPGTYRARVAGLGVSDPFVIDAQAYDDVTRVVARGLYHQRSGTALTLTEHPHGVSHIDPAVYHDSITLTPLYNGEPVGMGKDVHGGWHDAGDYNKYIPTGASALWFLLTSFDISHNLLSAVGGVGLGDDWNIPESGNGVPDILDEAHRRHQNRCASRMLRVSEEDWH